MLRQILSFVLFFCWMQAFASEWKNLKQYQKETGKVALSSSDWLTADRLKNSGIWHNANIFNLKNNGYLEYQTINQRTSFYKWYGVEIEKKGHTVVWPKMAYFISRKLHLTKNFPYNLLVNKDVKVYSYKGSEVVFNAAFTSLKELFFSSVILKGSAALHWDTSTLYKEQYVWLADLYLEMDAKTIKRLANIAKGNFLYGLVVPKSIRFKGDLSDCEDRYLYAVHTLRKYCKNTYW
ncbi:Insecticidal toxin complex protein [Cellulophaga sp. F20128]|uniref:Insecticidal toxin complex protein n=1 Tax=Cellulophaga sp. F20128 TaxID=2926413 RepID=UPI001FF601EE|nr:Insecticidal toxin complex protein [Cellulophaga sp. F20128]MCK0157727.1 Insecticidal toxin complex protein [Cellulophaga sp. F20128]